MSGPEIRLKAVAYVAGVASIASLAAAIWFPWALPVAVLLGFIHWLPKYVFKED